MAELPFGIEERAGPASRLTARPRRTEQAPPYSIPLPSYPFVFSLVPSFTRKGIASAVPSDPRQFDAERRSDNGRRSLVAGQLTDTRPWTLTFLYRSTLFSPNIDVVSCVCG